MPLKLILMFWVTSTHSHGQDPNLKMVDTGNMLLSPIWTRTKLKLETKLRSVEKLWRTPAWKFLSRLNSRLLRPWTLPSSETDPLSRKCCSKQEFRRKSQLYSTWEKAYVDAHLSPGVLKPPAACFGIAARTYSPAKEDAYTPAKIQ